MHLVVTLPQNRVYSGYFVATDDDGKLLTSGRCLGKADNGRARRANNLTRDPIWPYGDTPTGTYFRTKAIIFAIESDRYGKGTITLEGATGDALAAVGAGRTGLLIHAGRPYTDGRLVPTYGCLRVSPEDFDKIVEAAAGGWIHVTIEDEQ